MEYIPKIIYDGDGAPMKVFRTNKIFFKDKNIYGYVFHIERAERITSVSEFELEEKDGKLYLLREIFKEQSCF